MKWILFKMSSKCLSVTKEGCMFFIRVHGGIFENNFSFRKSLRARHLATVGRMLPASHILCTSAVGSLN